MVALVKLWVPLKGKPDHSVSASIFGCKGADYVVLTVRRAYFMTFQQIDDFCSPPDYFIKVNDQFLAVLCQNLFGCAAMENLAALSP